MVKGWNRLLDVHALVKQHVRTVRAAVAQPLLHAIKRDEADTGVIEDSPWVPLVIWEMKIGSATGET